MVVQLRDGPRRLRDHDDDDDDDDDECNAMQLNTPKKPAIDIS